MPTEKTNQILTEAVLSKKARIEANDRDIVDYQEKIILLEAQNRELQEQIDAVFTDVPAVDTAVNNPVKEG
ncbi:MAG: hypothetical protein V1767_00975 [Chloroflexota bacterium]